MRRHGMGTSCSLLVAGLVLGASLILAPRSADAFCGFYVGGADAKLFNNATQVVVMREGTRTVLSMQNNYQGPPENFALVVPVPVVLQKENVKTLPRAIFAKVDQLTAPRLVEYWEQDPCYVPKAPEGVKGRRYNESAAARPAPPGGGSLGVTVEAQFTVAEYEIVILSAKDAAGLDTWLKEEKYRIPDGAEQFFRPYVEKGSKFFVAKVDPKKVTFDNGMATLSPLRFHYDDETFTLPIRLGLMNAKDAQDLIVNIIARRQRYEVANYPNATIPTNLDVSENARDQFGQFYASLFDRTLEKNPKAVVTEYAWATGSCDPCPGPTLDGGDMKTLGADALPAPECPTGLEAEKPPFRPECRPWGRFADFVITRLHARYSKESLGEDLVFRAASPIAGGREMRSGDGKLEHGRNTSTVNNFQGRYAIRHPWTGPIECKNPRRGIWGGPPGGKDQPPTSGPPAKAAKDLAFVSRKANLASFVRSDAPEIDFKADVAPPPSSSNGGGSGGDRKSSRCGCDVPGVPVSGAPAVAVAIAALMASRRRRGACS